MPSPRRILLLLVSITGAALVGWIAAASMAPETRASASRQAEDPQIELLLDQLQDQDNLSEADRGLLLERLVALERLQEAEVVLDPWLSGRTTPRKLTCSKRTCNVAMASPRQPGAASKICFGCIRMIRRFCNFLCLWTKSRDAIGRPQRSSPPGSKTWSLANVWRSACFLLIC